MFDAWLGTEESFNAHCDKYEALRVKFGAVELARLSARLSCDEDEEETCKKHNGFRWPNPVGLEIVNSVAVLSIAGGTEAKTTWLTRLFGTVTYEDIRFRMMEAYENAECHSLMLLLDTPGGMAKGAFALAEFIDRYAQNIKPVLAYTDGSVASAGVLYGTASAGLFADRYAEVGSVGAVAVFMDITGMLEKNGVRAKVIRSAPYKAVPNRYEKLDAKGEEVLNETIMRLHNQFVQTLSVNLKMNPAVINKNIATGRMFDASTSVTLGLAKGITTYEKLVATMHQKYQNTITSAARPI